MLRLFVVLAAALLLPATVSGARAAGAALLAQSDATAQKVFSALERRVIREVLGASDVATEERRTDKGGKGTSPGPAKRNRLPPGLQQQLQRNGRLPPGLEKKAFPAHLRAQLPSPLRGTERVIIGNDAVLIDTATNVVLDIIRDVVVNR